MEATFDRVAMLFKESNLVREEQWKNYFRMSNSSKDIIDVLQQDVSLATFKDLIFAEIPTPFSKARKHVIHDVLSNQLRLSNYEMLTILKAFKPDVEEFMSHLLKAALVNSTDVQAALRKHDLDKNDPYEQLLRQNVLNPDLLSRFFARPELRYGWPYRHDLMLSILECNAIIETKEAKSLRESPNLAEAMKAYFGQSSSVGIDVFTRARTGLSLPRADVKASESVAQLARRFPAEMVRRMRFLPLEDDGQILKVAFADPLNLAHGDLLFYLTGRRILPFAAPGNVLLPVMDEIFGQATTDSTEERVAPETSLGGTSTVQMVSSIIESAIDLKATDIHLEPRDDSSMRVRYRIDGRLRNIMRIPPDMVPQIISRIKVLANMDVTERRRPQDGHFDLEAGDVHFDFRISTLPCHIGEKVVIRVLDETRVGKGLGSLGLLDVQRQSLERMLQLPYGMILTTGPTGSGKTSTLYACLQMVNSMETNIVTIEDPVEYQLSGVNQVAVNPEIELGFAQGLRAILRQDPDVIMVGEIRDLETASIAVRAAMTGHLVFSTLHSNTALGAYGTLMHMGIKSYLSAAAIIALVAQRLVRQICTECVGEMAPDPVLASMLWGNEQPPDTLPCGKGCSRCMGTGYQGRTGLYEINETRGELRRYAAEGASEAKLAEMAAMTPGYMSMAQAGREKILAGETSLEEVCQQVMTLAI